MITKEDIAKMEEASVVIRSLLSDEILNKLAVKKHSNSDPQFIGVRIAMDSLLTADALLMREVAIMKRLK